METGTSLLLSGYPVRHYHPYTGIDLVVETTKDHWPGGNSGGGDTPARDWDDQLAGREPYSRICFLKSCFGDLVKGAAWTGEARLFSSLPGKKCDQVQFSLGSKPYLPSASRLISILLSFCSLPSHTFQFHVNSEASQRGTESNLCFCPTSEKLWRDQKLPLRPVL